MSQHFQVLDKKGSRCNCTVPQDRMTTYLSGRESSYSYANLECPDELLRDLRANGVSLVSATKDMKLKALPPKLPARKTSSYKIGARFATECEHGKTSQTCCIESEVA